MTQSSSAGISGRRAVWLLGGLVYELIKGQAPSQQARERSSPLPSLTETGNRALRRALAMSSESGSYQSCEEFWKALKENTADRISRASRHTAAASMSEPCNKVRKEGTNPYSTAERRNKPSHLEALETDATSMRLDKMRTRRTRIVGISLAIFVCACAGLVICFEFLGSRQKSRSRPNAELAPSPTPFVSDLIDAIASGLYIKVDARIAGWPRADVSFSDRLCPGKSISRHL
jgi:hypothetical protein